MRYRNILSDKFGFDGYTKTTEECCFTTYLAHICAYYLAHKEYLGSISSGLPDDQVLLRQFNDVHRECLKAVDPEYALH
jgi:hypothetical protein